MKKVKPGRDWKGWFSFIYLDQKYICRHMARPFPKKGDPRIDKDVKSPYFTIKTWGTKGYK